MLLLLGIVSHLFVLRAVCLLFKRPDELNRLIAFKALLGDFFGMLAYVVVYVLVPLVFAVAAFVVYFTEKLPNLPPEALF